MDRFVRSNAGRWAAAIVALATAYESRAQDVQGNERAPQAPAEPAAHVPSPELEQIVVLRDGGVLSGRIKSVGDRYVLTRGGGEMQIPAANVMLVAASLEDAYQQRRQQMARPTADAHLTLAEWCLRHDLLPHAERESGDARAIDAGHKKLALLERRLALANERQQRKADAHSSNKPESPAAPFAPVQSSISDLPEGAVERFTRKVQPVLVNNCTTAGCHQPGGAEKFQLDRAVLRGLSNRRSTMNNLAATLELIDRDHPKLSPLLTVPRITHGGMKGPIFGPRQEQAFRHLVEWVALVAETTSTSSPERRAADGIELAAGDSPSRWASPVMREAQQSLYQESAPGDLTDTARGATGSASVETVPSAPAEPVAHQQSIRYGAQLQRWQPRDAFDPEIFNRQSAARAGAFPSALKGTVPPDERRESR